MVRLLPILLALAGSSVAVGQDAVKQNAAPGRKYALLIGVKHYDNVNFTNLHFTENDVVKLGELLSPQGYEVVLLSDSQAADRQPTRSNILKHLEPLVKEKKREDILLFAFAGHGLQFEGDKTSYFLPRDAEPGDSTTMISLQTVYDKLENCGAGVKLMFVDACRNHAKKVRGRSAFDDQTPPPPRGVCAMFSCSAGQLAYEDPALRHGIFFYHLLQGLKGEAKNRKGEVTLFGLADYASQMVRDSGHNQSPVLKGESSNGVLFRHLLTNSIGMELVYIPQGKFLMGSPKSEQDQFRKERDHVWAEQEKQHEVTISKGFYVGKYTVTQHEYQTLIGKNPSHFSAAGEGREAVKGMDTSRFPVENINWHEAAEFCRKLSQKEGKTYRLPTEAEWEYACRAGTRTAFHFGDTLTAEQANFDAQSPFNGSPKGVYRRRPTPVGSFPPNAWGLHDMHGNMGQWCADWFNYQEYDRGACVDPQGPTTGTDRVVRGSCWNSMGAFCRSALRYSYDPAKGTHSGGLRVLLELTP